MVAPQGLASALPHLRSLLEDLSQRLDAPAQQASGQVAAQGRIAPLSPVTHSQRETPIALGGGDVENTAPSLAERRPEQRRRQGLCAETQSDTASTSSASEPHATSLRVGLPVSALRPQLFPLPEARLPRLRGPSLLCQALHLLLQLQALRLPPLRPRSLLALPRPPPTEPSGTKSSSRSSSLSSAPAPDTTPAVSYDAANLPAERPLVTITASTTPAVSTANTSRDPAPAGARDADDVPAERLLHTISASAAPIASTSTVSTSNTSTGATGMNALTVSDALGQRGPRASSSGQHEPCILMLDVKAPYLQVRNYARRQLISSASETDKREAQETLEYLEATFLRAV